ncbi:MAG: GNAT family N-acetyltransferase [Pseudomonadota bacterium]
MMAPIRIDHAHLSDTPAIAEMVGELLDEIMRTTGNRAFHFNLDETTALLKTLLEQGKYYVLVARDEEGTEVGFATLCESFALYAEGAYGTIPELYVRPQQRSRQVGQQLIQAAKAFGQARQWKRLEVTTPQLPQFDRTLAFYEREGFSIAGGRKLKMAL